MRRVIASLTGAALAAAALLWAPTAPPARADDLPAFGSRLYVDPTSDAQRVYDSLLAQGDTARAALIGRIASQPTAVWLGDWYTPTLLASVIQRHLRAAAAQGATPVFVTYAIPNRDCGGYSAGGYTADRYLDWTRQVAAALAGSRAVVLVEPDSLAMLSSAKCAGVAATRLPLLQSAVGILAAAGLSVYLDGGNARWLTPDAQAAYLNAAGVAGARGFFTNVSNFDTTQTERDYAGKVSSRVGWKHFVIDVSRNGNGWTGTWRNPPGAGLGQNPQITQSTSVKLDALLWVKHPGASDGPCNGGPPAGAWYESAAEALVLNSPRA
ncbi:glycoside hydrolase family 6 protein [Leifsonia sp. C5G2]|uniref:glycoside hydrolase family 6 protein n=1 Tax=Leifsonia sp. C5G2 TaxID=2735269 RepID=UPI00158525BE|nr:glycoside hydrolase family 6 protein [Leifsonia sp. C5G2]NUU07281.1 glycoside hydrolase family 6 protein [Leifsonia sp. C5G2]